MRKNLLSWMCASAMLGSILASCSSNSTEYIAASEDGDSWGVIKKDGEVVFADEFDSRISAPRHGIFTVETNGNYTIYSLDKKPKAVKGCEDLKAVGYCYDSDLLPICRPNERISVINTKGITKFTLDPIGGNEITLCDAAFSNGVLMISCADGKMGGVDESGKVVIKPRYDYIHYFIEDYTWAQKDEKYYIIDKKGEEKVKIKGDYYPRGNVKHGMLVVKDEDRCGFLDVKSGDIKKCPPSVRSVENFNKDLYVFYDGDEYGIMSMDGEKLVSAKYKSLKMLDDGKNFLARKDDDFMIIDKEGEKKTDLSDYDYVIDLGEENQILVAREGKYWSLIDVEGKKIDKNEYKDMSTNPSLCNNVSSNYTDINGIATSAVDLIDNSGIGNVKLGSAPSKYLANNPSSYTYTSMFTPDITLPSGYNYSMTLKAFTDSSIARYDYYSSSYYFEPDCKIYKLVLTIDLPSEEETREAVMDKIESMLEAKGFKKDGSDGDAIAMKNGATSLKLQSSYSSVKIELTK